MTHRAASIERLIDDSDIGARQFVIVALCGLLAMVDGFDGQAMAFAAPEIAKEFGIPTADFGAIFSAGSFGSLTGVLIQGPLGDRHGRKTVMLGAFLVVGMTSLANVIAGALNELIGLRFLAGVGLGAALPNLFAITSEYVPKRRRSTFVTIMFCGVPLGAVLGGMATASFLPLHGWRLVFYLGGFLPLALLPAAWLLVPESLSYLLTRPRGREQIAEILGRIDIKSTDERGAGPAPASANRSASPPTIAQLFARRRVCGTILLSMISFLSLLISISLSNWLPLILDQAGVGVDMAVMGGVMLSGGGMLGAVVFAILTDRYSVYKILGPAYFVAALSIALIGATPPLEGWIASVIFSAGFFFIGAQMCFPTLVAVYYPSPLRAAGIGWTMGAGRIGAIVGPAIAGFLLARNVAPNDLFYLASGVTLLAMVAVIVLGYVHRAPPH